MEHTKNIPDCPVEMTLQLIGDKWKVLIIRDLLTGTKRFNELMRSVSGITQKVLTSHLRAMEKDTNPVCDAIHMVWAGVNIKLPPFCRS